MQVYEMLWLRPLNTAIQTKALLKRRPRGRDILPMRMTEDIQPEQLSTCPKYSTPVKLEHRKRVMLQKQG